MQPQKFVPGRNLAFKSCSPGLFFFSLNLNLIHLAIFKSEKDFVFLKVEIPNIVLVSEGIFRELTGAAGLCLLPCPHSASLQQTYFVLFWFCTLSQPMIGTDKSVVVGLFFLVLLFHSIRYLQKPITGYACWLLIAVEGFFGNFLKITSSLCILSSVSSFYHHV